MSDDEQLTEFTKAVHDAVRRIPPGSVATYKEVATAAGRPNAARAVGTVMAKNAKRCYLAYETGGDDAPTYEEMVPCHRVVNACGKHTGYLGDTSARAIKYRTDLLEKERMQEHLKKVKSEVGDMDARGHLLAPELQGFRFERPDAPVTEFFGWHHDNLAAAACEQEPAAKRIRKLPE